MAVVLAGTGTLIHGAKARSDWSSKSGNNELENQTPMSTKQIQHQQAFDATSNDDLTFTSLLLVENAAKATTSARKCSTGERSTSTGTPLHSPPFEQEMSMNGRTLSSRRIGDTSTPLMRDHTVNTPLIKNHMMNRSLLDVDCDSDDDVCIVNFHRFKYFY
jgi:hypothetical protein